MSRGALAPGIQPSDVGSVADSSYRQLPTDRRDRGY